MAGLCDILKRWTRMRWQYGPGINNDVITSQADGDIRMLLPAYFRGKMLCRGCRS